MFPDQTLGPGQSQSQGQAQGSSSFDPADIQALEADVAQWLMKALSHRQPGFSSAGVGEGPVNWTTYGPQPQYNQAPFVNEVALGGFGIGYPSRCTLGKALTACYPQVHVAGSMYPLGAAASRSLLGGLVYGPPVRVGDPGLYLASGPDVDHYIPGLRM